jgi:hypothetical protein
MKNITLSVGLVLWLTVTVAAQSRSVAAAASLNPVRTQITFCDQVLRQTYRSENLATYSDYTFILDQRGRPIDIAKTATDYLTGNEVPDCISKWSITGLPAGSALKVNWDYSAGFVEQTVSSPLFRHVLRVADGRKELGENFGCSGGELTTIVSNKEILALFEVPPLTMRRALEIAEALLQKDNIDMKNQYLFDAQIEWDRERDERYWVFRWSAAPLIKRSDCTIRVRMDGTAERIGGIIIEHRNDQTGSAAP